MENKVAFDVLLPAIRLGFARAISDLGMTPDQAEQKLAAFSKEADPSSVVSTPILNAIEGLVKNYTLGAALAGAGIGAGSAMIRHNLEQRAAGHDDSDIETAERKRDGYKRMSQDLTDNMNAQSPAFTAPKMVDVVR